MFTSTTGPGVSGGSAAGYGVCAAASSAAFAGACPAKLWEVEPPVIPAIAGVVAAAARVVFFVTWWSSVKTATANASTARMARPRVVT